MDQKEFRDWDKKVYSPEESYNIITELFDRTKSNITGLNSILELGNEVLGLIASVAALELGEAAKMYNTLADMTADYAVEKVGVTGVINPITGGAEGGKIYAFTDDHVTYTDKVIYVKDVITVTDDENHTGNAAAKMTKVMSLYNQLKSLIESSNEADQAIIQSTAINTSLAAVYGDNYVSGYYIGIPEKITADEIINALYFDFENAINDAYIAVVDSSTGNTTDDFNYNVIDVVNFEAVEGVNKVFFGKKYDVDVLFVVGSYSKEISLKQTSDNSKDTCFREISGAAKTPEIGSDIDLVSYDENIGIGFEYLIVTGFNDLSGVLKDVSALKDLTSVKDIEAIKGVLQENKNEIKTQNDHEVAGAQLVSAGSAFIHKQYYDEDVLVSHFYLESPESGTNDEFKAYVVNSDSVITQELGSFTFSPVANTTTSIEVVPFTLFSGERIAISLGAGLALKYNGATDSGGFLFNSGGVVSTLKNGSNFDATQDFTTAITFGWDYQSKTTEKNFIDVNFRVKKLDDNGNAVSGFEVAQPVGDNEPVRKVDLNNAINDIPSGGSSGGSGGGSDSEVRDLLEDLYSDTNSVFIDDYNLTNNQDTGDACGFVHKKTYAKKINIQRLSIKSSKSVTSTVTVYTVTASNVVTQAVGTYSVTTVADEVTTINVSNFDLEIGDRIAVNLGSGLDVRYGASGASGFEFSSSGIGASAPVGSSLGVLQDFSKAVAFGWEGVEVKEEADLIKVNLRLQKLDDNGNAVSGFEVAKPVNFNSPARVKDAGGNQLAGVEVVFDGDSMMDGDATDEDKTWRYLVSERNGIVMINNAIDGNYLTSIDDGSGGKLGLGTPMVDRFLDNIPSTARMYVSHICTNDINNPNVPIGTINSTDIGTIAGALNTVLEGVKTNRPLCKTGIITPYIRPSVGGTRNQDAVDMMIAVCQKHNVPCFDNTRQGNIDFSNIAQAAALLLDPYHLNNEGHLRVSYGYENFMKRL